MSSDASVPGAEQYNEIVNWIRRFNRNHYDYGDGFLASLRQQAGASPATFRSVPNLLLWLGIVTLCSVPFQIYYGDNSGANNGPLYALLIALIFIVPAYLRARTDITNIKDVRWLYHAPGNPRSNHNGPTAAACSLLYLNEREYEWDEVRETALATVMGRPVDHQDEHMTESINRTLKICAQYDMYPARSGDAIIPSIPEAISLLITALNDSNMDIRRSISIYMSSLIETKYKREQIIRSLNNEIDRLFEIVKNNPDLEVRSDTAEIIAYISVYTEDREYSERLRNTFDNIDKESQERVEQILANDTNSDSSSNSRKDKKSDNTTKRDSQAGSEDSHSTRRQEQQTRQTTTQRDSETNKETQADQSRWRETNTSSQTDRAQRNRSNANDSMMSSYRDVLDVSSDASEETIRDAYRSQVKQWHPDNSDHEDADEIFMDIKQARDGLVGGDTQVGNPAADVSTDRQLAFVWEGGEPVSPVG